VCGLFSRVGASPDWFDETGGQRATKREGKATMQDWEKGDAGPELKELVAEASQALARLDADRLEELALSCRILNRDLIAGSAERRAELVRQAGDAREKMALFGRVLDVTRANLNVMNRLKELREVRLEYGAEGASCWAPTENRHGDH